jgi:hypothetical protein
MAEPASAGAEFGHDQAYSCRVDSTRAEGAEPINAIFEIRPLPMVLEAKTVVKRG